MSDGRRIHAALMAAERNWAESRRLEHGADALAHWQENFLSPLSSASQAELGRSAAVLDFPDGKPGPLNSLGSGFALAVNLFEPWRGPGASLADALPSWGLDDGELAYASAPAAEAGRGSEVDILLSGATRGPVAVVPLFAEPFADIDPRTRDGGFADGDAWQGLDGCALLAKDLQATPRRFLHLDAGRVLAVARGMVARFGRHGFRLAVLYFDAGGRASAQLGSELGALRMRIGGEIDLIVDSWQNVFAKLSAHAAVKRDYTQSLEERYFETRSPHQILD